ncbi:NFATC2-interacting protein isoform X2 [Oryzias melastigma]|nr:NFATC2-interacting protein isoform X2 [Oryzias melastigma]XP_024117967.1 NFATC2-interacting protein isoform X2 [Oryzias melastigma]XP_024117968.1 NFATC2-interacting protein isoform X2 [Oryzias melastigma]
MKPPPKRRRILDPSAITPVPIYSNKVSSGLQLKPTTSLFNENENADDADDCLWAEFSCKEPAEVVCLSDSEEEFGPHLAEPREECVETPHCPSPPPESPVQKQSRKVRQKTSEINRRLQAASSILSPKSGPSLSSCTPPPVEEDDDIIILEAPGARRRPASSSPACRMSLKVRCRTEIHRVPVLPSTPLGEVLGQLSVILKVPPSQLLLLREEEELSPQLTVDELRLGIADIIDCVVMATEEQSSSITVRLQSRDRGSSQSFSVLRDAPLASIFSQYLSGVEAAARSKARFQFDGTRVTGEQTAAQLDMEDGDIVEVWI